MAVNMDTYQESFKYLDENLRNDLFEMFLEKKGIFESEITKIIKENYDLEDEKISELITDKFIYPMQYAENTLADFIVSRVETIITSINTLDENGYGNSNSVLAVLLNELSRNYVGKELRDIANAFLTPLKPSEENKIPKEASLPLEEYLETLVDDIISRTKNIIKEEINTFNKSIKFNETKTNTSDDLLNLNMLSSFTNYRFVKEDDSLFFVNDDFDLKYPVVKSKDKTYRSQDGEVEFVFDESSWHFIDGESSSILSDRFIAVGTRENPYMMQINYGFSEVDFLYNGDKVENPEIIRYICQEIKNKYPKLYSKSLQNNEVYLSAEKQAFADSKDNEKFTVDEKGVTHINPRNEEYLKDLLSSIGYTISEDANFIYLTNQKGQKLKASINESTINLEDGVTITLDLYRILKDKPINGPEIVYNNKDLGVVTYINQDFSQVTLINDENFYVLRVTSKGLEGYSNISGTVEKNLDNVISVIKYYIPGVLSNMESLAKVKKEVKEDSQFISASSPYSELIKEITLADAEEAKDFSENELSEMSVLEINNRLTELTQDAKVQEYLALLNKSEEIKAITSETSDGPKL